MLGHYGVMMESSRKLESLLYISSCYGPGGIAENVLDITFRSSVRMLWENPGSCGRQKILLEFTSFML